MESDEEVGLGTPEELEHCRNVEVEGHKDSVVDRNMQDSVGIQGEGQGIPVVGVDIDHPFEVGGRVVGNADYDFQEWVPHEAERMDVPLMK